MLLDAVGDRAGALRAYEEFARRLQQELEIEPAPETRALVDAVRARPTSVVPAPSIPPPAAPAPPAAHQPVEPAPRPAPAVRSSAPLPLAARPMVAGVVAIFLLALTSLTLAPARGPALVAERVLVVPFENRTGDKNLDVLGAMAEDREGAVRLLRESFAQGRVFGVPVHAEMDFEPLRDHPAFRELLRPKG